MYFGSNCTQRTDDFVSGKRTHTWTFAVFWNVAPVAIDTTHTAATTTSPTAPHLPKTPFTAPSSRSGFPRPYGAPSLRSIRAYNLGSPAVRDRLPPPARARADERVAHLGGAIAVLERRPVRPDLRVLGDRGQEMVE